MHDGHDMPSTVSLVCCISMAVSFAVAPDRRTAPARITVGCHERAGIRRHDRHVGGEPPRLPRVCRTTRARPGAGRGDRAGRARAQPRQARRDPRVGRWMVLPGAAQRHHRSRAPTRCQRSPARDPRRRARRHAGAARAPRHGLPLRDEARRDAQAGVRRRAVADRCRGYAGQRLRRARRNHHEQRRGARISRARGPPQTGRARMRIMRRARLLRLHMRTAAIRAMTALQVHRGSMRARLVALTMLVAGCGRSVLIHGDDLTYLRAIEHFKRTRQAVTASLAPEDDQAIFLQAEGLFRYRFAPPGRSVGSYLAQITASIIDLPVLDSLAGSLDLDVLRLRASDGAVQLWESLLARNPSTPLRPLTLY